MDKLLLSVIPLETLLEGFREIVKTEIKVFQDFNAPEKLYSTAEAAQFLKVSKMTIYTWVKKGLLNKHTIGRRNYYKQSEILQNLKTLKKYGKY